MELDDLLKKSTAKQSPDDYQLSAKAQRLLLQQAICEISNKPGREVEIFLRFKSGKEIKQLLKDEQIAKIFYRLKQDHIASTKASNTEDYVKLVGKMKDAEDWKIIATVESYTCQICSNCKTEKTNYIGTFQVLQHKKYWDRRNLIRLDEQVSAIHESKVVKTDEIIAACYSCRKFLDSSNIEKEYGSLFKRLKG